MRRDTPGCSILGPETNVSALQTSADGRGARCCFLGRGEISLLANVGRPSPKMRRSPSARALAGGKLGPTTEKIGSEVVGAQGN